MLLSVSCHSSVGFALYPKGEAAPSALSSIGRLEHPGWLVKAVGDWLQSTGMGCLLICGPPGYGKTTASRLLASSYDWTYTHFASRMEDRASTDLSVMVVGLAAAISGEESPPTPTNGIHYNITVSQHAGTNLGEMIGVQLFVPAGADTQEVHSFLSRALSAGRTRRRERPVTILLDGLDEIDAPMNSVGRILQQLASTEGVRVVALTKPLADLYHYPIKEKTIIDYTDEPYRSLHRATVGAYISRVLPLVPSIQSKAKSLASAIDGNFQYAHALFRDRALNPLGDWHETPATLDVYYIDYLHRILIDSRPQQESLRTELGQLLALLSVLAAPVELEVLSDFLDTSQADTHRLVSLVESLLSIDRHGIRFHHSSLAETVRTGRLNPLITGVRVDNGSEFMRARILHLIDRNPSPHPLTLAYLAVHGMQHLLDSPQADIATLEALLDKVSGLNHAPSARTILAYTTRLVETGDMSRWLKLIRDLPNMHPKSVQLTGACLAKWTTRHGPKPLREAIERPGLFAPESLAHALYLIGYPEWAIDLIVTRADSQLRQQVVYSIYSIWSSRDRQSIFDLAERVSSRISLLHPKRSASQVSFLMELSILLYTHHVDDRQLIAWGDRLWHELLVERYRVRAILSIPFLRSLGSFIASRTLAAAVTKAALWIDNERPSSSENGVLQIQEFDQARQLLVDSASLSSCSAEIARLLDGSLAERTLASLLLGSTIIRHNKGADIESLHRLFASGDVRRRQWIIYSFGVLFNTGPEVANLVHRFTTAYVSQLESATTANGSHDIVRDCLFLLPNYYLAEKGLSAPVDLALPGGASDSSKALLCRAIGAAGVYAPNIALQQLEAASGHFNRRMLIDALAIIYPRWPLLVEDYLLRLPFPVSSHDVSAVAAIDTLGRVMRSVGLYNNCMAQICLYPTMLDELVKPFFDLVSTCSDLGELAKQYAVFIGTALEQHEFHLQEWTE